MKKIGFVLLLFLAACSTKTKRPSDILDEQTMINVLVEVHLAEAKLNNYQAEPATRQELFREFEQRILQNAGLDSATYKKSYDYYLENLEAMNVIYMAVKDTIENRRNQTSPVSN
jgi:Domain of unknown function (DUF4296)